MSRQRVHINFISNVGAVLMLSLLLLVSCYDDRQSGVLKETDTTRDLILSLTLPANISYSPSQGDATLSENYVETIDVFAFEFDRYAPIGSDEHFMYKTRATKEDIISAPGSRELKFKATLRKSKDKYQRLVFIINAEEEVDALGPIAEGTTVKDKLLKRIVYELGDKVWETTKSIVEDNTPLPMWGQYKDPVKIGSANPFVQPINAVRMVAKVDVIVGATAKDEFKLEEVYLYNRYSAGNVVPDPSVYNSNLVEVKDVTIPSSATPIEGPLAFYTDNKVSLTQQIYFFENRATNEQFEATCLVVGGRYKGSETTRYYRVDFLEGEDDAMFQSLLRNHHYDLVINNVLNGGHNTPDEAYRKSWGDVEVDMVPWSLEYVDFEDDKRFHLHADPTSFIFLKDGSEVDDKQKSLRVLSNYYEDDYNNGWSGHWIENKDDWVEFKYYLGGEANESRTLPFSVTEFPLSLQEDVRHAVLAIRAGNLTKYIDFWQTNQVVVNDNELEIIRDWITEEQDDDIRGPYRLGVSKTHFSIDSKAIQGLTLKVSTTFDEGYSTTLEPKSAVNWLRITENAKVDGAGDYDLKFNLEPNFTREERKAEIHLTAGNLTKKIVVKQSDTFKIELPDNEVIDWIESDDESISGDIEGPYRLGVGRCDFEFNRRVHLDIPLLIYATYHGGYSSSVIEGGDWLKINSEHPEGGHESAVAAEKTLYFDIVKPNTTNSTRTGFIQIKSGNLSKIIQVVQHPTEDVDGDSDIIEWEEALDTESDVIYRLGVSRTSFHYLMKEYKDEGFKLTSTYSKGYKINIVDEFGNELDQSDPNLWLKITSDNSSSNKEVTLEDIKFNVAENREGVDRKLIIQIESGMIKKRLFVTQTCQRDDGGGDTEGMDWTVSDPTESGTGGPYRLGVSKSHFNFSRNRYVDVQLDIATDYVDGYKVIEHPEWVELGVNDKSDGPDRLTMTFTVMENNDGHERAGDLRIRAGNIVKVIPIKQALDADLSDSELDMSWSEGHDSNLDIYYRLGVSDTYFNYAKEGGKSSFDITTTYSRGFVATIVDSEDNELDQSWIRFTSPSSSTRPVQKETISFEVDRNNIYRTRGARIKISSGVITKYLTVSQNSEVMGGGGTEGLEWTKGDPTENEVYGPYWLGVSQSQYRLSKVSKKGLELILSTTFEKGYRATVDAKDRGWIEIVDGGSNPNSVEKATLKFNVAVNNESRDRRGVILIESGSIIKKIFIDQSINAQIDDDSEIGDWDDNDDTNTDLDLVLSVSNTLFELERQSYSDLNLYISTVNTKGYMATTKDSWIKIVSGANSPVPVKESKLTFAVSENSTNATRVGAIYVRAGNLLKKIEVKQGLNVDGDSSTDNMVWSEGKEIEHGVDKIYRVGVDKTQFVYGKGGVKGAILNIATTHKKGYKVYVDYGEAEEKGWITIKGGGENSSEAPDGKAMTFSVGTNNSGALRSAAIVVESGNLLKAIPVLQSVEAMIDDELDIGDWGDGDVSDIELYFILSVSKSQFELEKGPYKDLSFEISTTNRYGYVVTSNVEWIKLKSGTGNPHATENEKLIFDVGVNDTNQPREGTISIKARGLIKRVVVKQNVQRDGDGSADNFDWTESDPIKGDAGSIYRLGVSQTQYEFARGGSSKNRLALITDYEGGYSVSATESWIKNITPHSGPKGETVLTFDIGVYKYDNTTEAPPERYGEIVVKAGSIEKIINLKQYRDAELGGDGETNDWDDGDETESGIDHALSVSQSHFKLDNKAYEGLGFNISTNFKRGYTATVSSDSQGWIEITSGATAAKAVERAPLRFNISKDKLSSPRRGTIEVRSGNIVKKVVIDQSVYIDGEGEGDTSDWEDGGSSDWEDGNDTESDVGGRHNLSLSETSFTFSNKKHVGHLTVQATGEGSWEGTSDVTWIQIDEENKKGVSNGEKTNFKFTVSENTKGNDRSGRITIRTYSGGANALKKDIVVSQRGDNILTVTDVSSKYDANSHKRQHIRIASSSPWLLDVYEDKDKLLQAIQTTGSMGKPKGENAYFILRTIYTDSKDVKSEYIVKLKVSSPNGEFHDKIITLKAIPIVPPPPKTSKDKTKDDGKE